MFTRDNAHSRYSSKPVSWVLLGLGRGSGRGQQSVSPGCRVKEALTVQDIKTRAYRNLTSNVGPACPVSPTRSSVPALPLGLDILPREVLFLLQVETELA